MKKLLAIILAMIMMFSFAACGNANSASEYNKAIITDKDGNVVEMTAKELCELYDSNTAKFNKLYERASITITGKIESINNYSNNLHTYYSINIDNGWELQVAEHSELGETIYKLNVGDTVKVTSKIQSAFGIRVTIYDIYRNSSGYHDNTTIKVVG